MGDITKRRGFYPETCDACRLIVLAGNRLTSEKVIRDMRLAALKDREHNHDD